jgi:hypothetical protein
LENSTRKVLVFENKASRYHLRDYRSHNIDRVAIGQAELRTKLKQAHSTYFLVLENRETANLIGTLHAAKPKRSREQQKEDRHRRHTRERGGRQFF